MIRMRHFLYFILLYVTNVFSIFATACTPDSVGNVTCSNFNANATYNIDLRIANKHDSTINLKIFASQDHAKGVFVRNPNCWASTIDLTCISPSHGAPPSYQCAGTLITPRHVLLAAHLAIKVGDSIRFVTKDNQTVTRKVILDSYTTDWSLTWPDVLVLLLDKDVPASITPCQFLPSNYALYLANDGRGLPVIYTDQEEKAIVSDLWQITSTNVKADLPGFNLSIPKASNRSALYEPIIGGDSGNPAFLVLNGQLVLLGVFTYSGGGSSLSYIANLPPTGDWMCRSLNESIQSVDSRAGVTTGHKIKLFDFGITSNIHKPTKSINQIFVINNILNLKLFENQSATIEVFDVFGRQITKRVTSGSDFSYILPLKGVYFVSVLKDKSRDTFKVIYN